MIDFRVFCHLNRIVRKIISMKYQAIDKYQFISRINFQPWNITYPIFSFVYLQTFIHMGRN